MRKNIAIILICAISLSLCAFAASDYEHDIFLQYGSDVYSVDYVFKVQDGTEVLSVSVTDANCFYEWNFVESEARLYLSLASGSPINTSSAIVKIKTSSASKPEQVSIKINGKTPPTVVYKFGQSVQIGLIEPWFLKANARVYTDTHPTNIDYSSLVDYGAYFIRASALSDKNATQESLTVEDIINNPASSKYSKSAGTATVDGSYITANYDKGLYTYELDDSVFVLFYVIDDAGITYAPIRERNLKSLLEARCNDVANFPNELERAVYKNMLAMFDAISAYRDDYFSKKLNRKGE